MGYGTVRRSGFRPAWWLRGPHLQTLWGALLRPRPSVATRRERLELPDGDFLDLDWTLGDEGPVVLILHGLEGSSDSHYARGLLAAAAARGWRGLVMHFRGCSGEPNRLERCYDAGDTRDIAHVVDLLHRREPATPLACVGYSLGGNALLKWLGETGLAGPVRAAAAVSVPFLLEAAARRMGSGLSRIYQRHLIGGLHASYRRKFSAHPAPPVSPEDLPGLADFFAFDDRVTARLQGYAGVEDYYRRASSRQYLHGIRVPTLLIHALDDPFLLPSAIPGRQELSDRTLLELSPHGGHVGFIGGGAPWRPVYWLEQRIPRFLARHLEPRGGNGGG
jgi:hypothetical protein